MCCRTGGGVPRRTRALRGEDLVPTVDFGLRCEFDRHATPAFRCACSVSCSILAATLTAMAAGSLPVMPGMPIGSGDAGKRFVVEAHAAQLLLKPYPLRLGSDQPDRTEARCSQCPLGDRQILGVIVGHDEHMRAGGQERQTRLRHRKVVHGDRCHCVGEESAVAGHSEPLRGEHRLPRVDEMQLDLLAAQDSRELEPHVSEPEDRDRRDRQYRFKQHRDLSSAALHAIVCGCLVAQRHGEQFGPRRGLGEHRACAIDGRRLQIAAADRSEERVPERRPSSRRRSGERVPAPWPS